MGAVLRVLPAVPILGLILLLMLVLLVMTATIAIWHPCGSVSGAHRGSHQ